MSSTQTPPAQLDALRLDSENPWPGLAAFTEQQHDFFFGREEEAGELFNCIKRDRITVLFGKSGLGKTSLLQAGLFPLLRNAAYLPIYMRLSYSDGVPSLDEQVRTAVESAINLADFAEVASLHPGESVWEYLHRRGGNLINDEGAVVTPVLLFDQFEEWFTLGTRKEFVRRLGDDFLPALTDLVENRTPRALSEKLAQNRDLAKRYDLESSGCRILITLREDYLANLENLRDAMPSLVFVDNRMRLTEMSGQQAFAVVTKPNPQLVESDVAEHIVRFVAGAHTDDLDGNVRVSDLPLEHLEIAPAILSLFCRQLNEARIGQRLPRITQALVAAQGVTIIDDFYQKCIADMPPALRRLIEDQLLTRAGYRDNIDLLQAKADLEAAGISPLYIDDLVRLRLLQVEEHRGVPRLELTHDVLADPVKRSRDKWEAQQAREKQQEQEREALSQARQAEQEALNRARFLQKVIAAVALAGVMLAGLLIFAVHELHRANEMTEQASQNAEKANQNAEKADKNAKEAERNRTLAEEHAAREYEMAGKAQLLARVADSKAKEVEGKETQLERVGHEALRGCLDVARAFQRAGESSKDNKESLSLFKTSEWLLMEKDRCFDEAQTIHEVAPNDLQIIDYLTTIALEAADTARQRGDNDAIIEYCKKARTAAEQEEKDPPSLSAEHRTAMNILLARTYLWSAFELAKADGGTAERDAQHGSSLIADINPATSNYANERSWERLSQAYEYRGRYFNVLKNDTETERAYDNQDQLRSRRIRVIEKQPKSVQRERDLVKANGDAADADEKIGRWGQAVKYRESALKVQTQLKDAYAGAQKDLAIAYDFLAWAEIYAGQFGKGLGHAQEGIDVAEKNKDRSTREAICTDTMNALRAKKRYDDARAFSDKYIQVLQQEPHSAERDHDLVKAYGRAADAEEEAKRWSSATSYRAQAVAILEALAPNADAGQRKELAIAYGYLAWDEAYAGDAAESFRHTQNGIKMAGQDQDRSTVWVLYKDGINALRANESYDDAHGLADEYAQSLNKEPQSTQRDRDLANAYGRAAEVEEARKRWASAVSYRNRALSTLLAYRPDSYDGARKEQAVAYSYLAWDEAYAGQVVKSFEHTQSGITLAEQDKDRSTLWAAYKDGINSLRANQSYDDAHKLAADYIQSLNKEQQNTQRDRELAKAYALAADVEEARKQWVTGVEYRKQALNTLLAFNADAYDGLHKDLALAYSDLAWAEIYNGEIQQSLVNIQKSLATAESTDRVTLDVIYRTAVRALVANKGYDEARRLSDHYIGLLRKEPEDVQRDRFLAVAYDDSARIEEGIAEGLQAGPQARKEKWRSAVDYRRRQVEILVSLNEKHAYESVQSDLSSAYGALSWFEILAGDFADGLEDARKGNALDQSQTWILVNEAHGLLLTDKVVDARALYLKIKDYPRGSNRTLLDDITDDFKQLCGLGYGRPELSEIAHDLGINNPELTQCFEVRANAQ